MKTLTAAQQANITTHSNFFSSVASFKSNSLAMVTVRHTAQEPFMKLTILKHPHLKPDTSYG